MELNEPTLADLNLAVINIEQEARVSSLMRFDQSGLRFSQLPIGKLSNGQTAAHFFYCHNSINVFNSKHSRRRKIMEQSNSKISQSDRNALANPKEKSIISQEIVGIRNIIIAETGTIHPVGFDIDALHGAIYGSGVFPNFCPGPVHVSGWVAYKGKRAKLHATQGRFDWSGHILDPATHFPVNDTATSLIRQPCTKDAYFDSKLPMVGNAALICDRKAYWVLRPHPLNPADGELEAFTMMLETKHDYINDYSERIFFHSTPSSNDIMAMMLRWL